MRGRTRRKVLPCLVGSSSSVPWMLLPGLHGPCSALQPRQPALTYPTAWAASAFPAASRCHRCISIRPGSPSPCPEAPTASTCSKKRSSRKVRPAQHRCVHRCVCTWGCVDEWVHRGVCLCVWDEWMHGVCMCVCVHEFVCLVPTHPPIKTR